MPNPIAASLALPDTDQTLNALHALGARIGRAEIRLDLMESFDLPRLLSAAPCPLIITCRPPREGGRFGGSEAERLAILHQAIAAQAAFVDVEWDSLAAVPLAARGNSQVIASRHWFNSMPADLVTEYRNLRDQADVVKLVGTATTLADVTPVLALLDMAVTPVIAIAMGEAGFLTRVLAPCFAAALLTFGAPNTAAATAPGQLTVSEMAEHYALDQAGPHTAIHLHLCDSAEAVARVRAAQAEVVPGREIHVALSAPATDAAHLERLRAYLPRLTIHGAA